MSALRVTVFRPTLGAGGADRVTLTLLNEMVRHDMRPTLLLLRKEGALIERCPSSVEVESLHAGSLWSCVGPLAHAVRRQRPDVLFSTSSGTNVPAVLAWEVLGRPCRLVLSERNVLFHGRRTLKRVIMNAAKRLLYPRAHRVTAVSEGVALDLERELGLRRSQIDVVYNPIVTEEVARGALEPVTHAFFDGSAPVIVAAGRLVFEKGFDVLLEAFAALPARCAKARLFVLGEGPLREALVGHAERLGVASRVAFAGFDPNPFKYMARARVFVLSSRHEGLPGALIQAMACGAAAVSTDCPSGPSEIIEEPERDGLLVPVDNAFALSAALARVIEDDALHESLAARAPLVAQRFGVEASLARYMGALRPQEVL